LLTSPTLNLNINTVMTKLTDAQKQQIDDLIVNTIVPALMEDGICEPDMSDKDVDKDKDFDEIYGDRLDVLYGEALTYLRNNLH